MLLAVSPTFVTTLLGLPFAGYALVVGWLSRRRSLRAGDRPGARRAGWGVGLGCAGFVYALVANLIVGGIILAALFALTKTFVQGTPTP